MDYNAKQGTISDLENTQVQSVESCNISVYTFFFCLVYFPLVPAASHFPDMRVSWVTFSSNQFGHLVFYECENSSHIFSFRKFKSKCLQ